MFKTLVLQWRRKRMDMFDWNRWRTGITITRGLTREKLCITLTECTWPGSSTKKKKHAKRGSYLTKPPTHPPRAQCLVLCQPFLRPLRPDWAFISWGVNGSSCLPTLFLQTQEDTADIRTGRRWMTWVDEGRQALKWHGVIVSMVQAKVMCNIQHKQWHLSDKACVQFRSVTTSYF